MIDKQVSYKEALKVWVKVAIYSFGGPAGQIAVMHKILVEERPKEDWLPEYCLSCRDSSPF